jgi:hypothetical protein
MVIPRNLNSNFRFQIHPITARDFPVTAVTGNPDPLGIFFLSGTKILTVSEAWVLCDWDVMHPGMSILLGDRSSLIRFFYTLDEAPASFSLLFSIFT